MYLFRESSMLGFRLKLYSLFNILPFPYNDIILGETENQTHSVIYINNMSLYDDIDLDKKDLGDTKSDVCKLYTVCFIMCT